MMRIAARSIAWLLLGALAHTLTLGPIDWSSPLAWCQILLWPLVVALATIIPLAPAALIAIAAWIAWALVEGRWSCAGVRQRRRPF